MNSHDSQLMNKIRTLKNELGKRIIMLAHHYQKKEIVELADYSGDSFGLSQKAASDSDAEYIVFCGVHFMAESAAILAGKNQTVQIPDNNAGCWMSEMAESIQVEDAWKQVINITGKGSVTPMVYMNSEATIKAHCGKNDGIICTSSNALEAFKWAFQRREKIFFFPDEHLGRNTGNRMGFAHHEMILWDRNKPLGGNSEKEIKDAKVILWNGYCLVHTRFTVEQMEEKRKVFPKAKIVVHPECTQDVVNIADAVGSTDFIVNYVKEASAGSEIIIATEVNLIERLAILHQDKKIIPLISSICPNMAKINLENLLWTLENIGEVNIVNIPKEIKSDAKVALDNMLSLS